MRVKKGPAVFRWSFFFGFLLLPLRLLFDCDGIEGWEFGGAGGEYDFKWCAVFKGGEELGWCWGGRIAPGYVECEGCLFFAAVYREGCCVGLAAVAQTGGDDVSFFVAG